MKRLTQSPTISLLLALAASGSFERAALAQDPVPSNAPADDNDRARALYRQATAAFERMRPEEALAGFRASWNIRKTHDVALSLGQVELVLKKYRDAAEHLDFAIRHFPPMESSEMLETARKALAGAKQQVATVKIIVNRPGAEVLVDSQIVGVAPLDHPIFLEPGQRTILARDPNATARSDVSSQTLVAEAAGEHTVTLQLGSAGATTSRSVAETSRPTNVVPLVVGGVVGLAGLGIGTGFALAASSKKSRADSLRADLPDGACNPSNGPAPACADLRDAVDAHDRNRNISTAGFVVGGVAIVGTVGYWLFTRAPSKQTAQQTPALRIHAVATQHERGLWLSGTW
jgi:hypothetical protein